MKPTKGERIRRLRERLGDTQEEFADRIDMSVESVRGWEQERHQPSSAAWQIIKLCAKTNRMRMGG